MFDGYADYAGTEIINTERAVAYSASAGLVLGCDTCFGLHRAINDQPYESPSQPDNEAPWYDASLPESNDFLGVIGMGVTGLSRNPVERGLDPLVGGGSLLGSLRRTHREISYEVMLVARTDCAMEYGIAWLSSALMGATCSDATCMGDQLCMFSCCPVAGETVSPEACDYTTAGPTADTFDDDDPGTRQLRHLYGVGLMEGPEITEQQYLPGGFVLATVTFVLAASRPYIFREPLDTGTDWTELALGDIVGPIDPDRVYDQCPEFDPCLKDPTCTDPPLPYQAPVPANPCYKGGPGLFRRTVITIDPLSPPQWLETVPVIEISTGGSAMRRLFVRFWTNPDGGPCSDITSNPCDACFDMSINYLPAGASLLVDGRTQRASVGCPQGNRGYVQSTPAIYGTKGAMFEWPVFSCPTAMCIEILTDANATSVDARARVLLVPRADAG
jgi:hypothetical protein